VFSDQEKQQVAGRIHRYPQPYPCFAYDLVLQDTSDEILYAMAQGKAAMMSSLEGSHVSSMLKDMFGDDDDDQQELIVDVEHDPFVSQASGRWKKRSSTRKAVNKASGGDMEDVSALFDTVAGDTDLWANLDGSLQGESTAESPEMDINFSDIDLSANINLSQLDLGDIDSFDIDVGDINIDSFDIDVGDIDVQVDDVDIDVQVDDVDIDVQVDDVDIDVQVDDADIDIQAANLDFDIQAGNIDIDIQAGDMDTFEDFAMPHSDTESSHGGRGGAAESAPIHDVLGPMESISSAGPSNFSWDDENLEPPTLDEILSGQGRRPYSGGQISSANGGQASSSTWKDGPSQRRKRPRDMIETLDELDKPIPGWKLARDLKKAKLATTIHYTQETPAQPSSRQGAPLSTRVFFATMRQDGRSISQYIDACRLTADSDALQEAAQPSRNIAAPKVTRTALMPQLSPNRFY
jgi:hypothetical protein